MKKILILGATGSTGLYLVDYLVELHKYVITATGRNKRDNNLYNENDVKYIQLDISDKNSFLNLPTDIDVVVHLAGLAPSRVEGYDPYDYININTIGTLNVLEFCRVNKIQKLIFAQSHSDVHGYWNTGMFIPADVPRKLNYKGDHSVYVISKTAACDLIQHYHEEFGIQTIIFRMPTIYCYWPDDTLYINGKKHTMAYLSFIKKAINGEEIEIWGDPSVAKDMIYVKDFIKMVQLGIESETAQGIYNAGTGIATTLEEQILGIIDVFCDNNKKSNVVYCPEKPTQASYLYDISKTKSDLGFEVNYTYKKSLEDMKKEMNNKWFKILRK